jgi:hypothetical protein
MVILPLVVQSALVAGFACGTCYIRLILNTRIEDASNIISGLHALKA